MTTNLIVTQGADFGIRWPIVDPLTQQPVDCTGGTVKAQVRVTPSDAAVLHEWSTSAGNATADATGVSLYVPAATSTGWGFTGGVYDVHLTLNGSTTLVASGRVGVNAAVTHG